MSTLLATFVLSPPEAKFDKERHASLQLLLPQRIGPKKGRLHIDSLPRQLLSA